MRWITLLNARLMILGPVLLAAMGRALAAQQAARSDRTRPTVVFSEVFRGPGTAPEYLVLEAGTTYRVEIEPATAIVAIVPYRQPTQPALAMSALENPPGPAGGATYVVVPRVSAEYEVRASVGGDEPVRVRIIRDPREQEMMDRAVRSTGAYLILDARAVTIAGVHAQPGSVTDDSLIPTSTLTGVEACLAIREGRARPSRRLGGCLARVGYYRSPATNFLAFGVAPRFTVLERGRLHGALVLDYTFGQTDESAGGGQAMAYNILGLGFNVQVPLMAGTAVEIEPGIVSLHHQAMGACSFTGQFVCHAVPAESDMAPRLLVALQLLPL